MTCTQRFDLQDDLGFPDFYADDLAEDAEGNLWILSGRRVGKFNGSQLIVLEVEDGLLDTSCNRLAVDAQGVVYRLALMVTQLLRVTRSKKIGSIFKIEPIFFLSLPNGRMKSAAISRRLPSAELMQNLVLYRT